MDLIKQLGPLAFASRLKRLGEKLQKDVSKIYKDQSIEFEARWFPVLYALKSKKCMSVTAMAKTLGLTHPAINQVAGIMTRRGLLESIKDKDDDRRRLLSLTQKGKETIKILEPIWTEIASATMEVIDRAGADFLENIELIENQLENESIYERINQGLKRRQFEAIEIDEFKVQYKKYFKSLNVEWLNHYLSVTKVDEDTLSNPGKIIKEGGIILFAKLNGSVIGTGSLINHANGSYELAKMAVDPKFRGKQAGKKLALALIDKCKKLKAKKLYLLTSPKLETALKLYHQIGFRDKKMPDQLHNSCLCSIYMEYDL
ncbi:MAG: bifunctional helix-turn-helix transcriptional regulator/GNAT family N-acetyltransferase [bacterium]